MSWQLRVYFDKIGPSVIPVDTVDYPGDRPADLDWIPPEDPPWGKRGGTYSYIWYRDGFLEVPMLIGQGRQYAETILQDMNVVVVPTDFVEPVDPGPGYGRAPDTVMTQSAPVGTFIPDGTLVTLGVVQ